MQDTFGLHELAVEDAQSFHLRPKVEAYEGGITFVVLRTARYVDEREEVEFGEVSIFVGPGFIITVRQGVAQRPARGAPAARAAPEAARGGPRRRAVGDPRQDRRRLRARSSRASRRDIEEVEQTVFSGSRAPTHRIYLLRREVDRLLPRRPPAARPGGRDHPGRRAGDRPTACASTSATSTTTSSSSTRRSSPSATC